MTRTPDDTRRLEATASGLAEAARLLRAGGLVAFPTETVYGLGADARNDTAVARIFAAKGRPSFNPLIVHVSDFDMAASCGVIGDQAHAFAEKNWPGPVSMVVPLAAGSGLSPLVTAGLPSVALRMPESDLARSLIAAFGGPVAAPSANPSGRVSPTTAAHVLAGLDGQIDAVLDGGPTTGGLESTIISFLGETPTVLREGGFISDFPSAESRADAPVAPGQLASHYAPQGAVRLNAIAAEPGEFMIGFGDVPGDVSLSPTGDLIEAAARLYAALHEADARDAARVAVAPIPEKGIGRAINDRLRRAAAPRS